MDRGAWWSTVGGAAESDMTEVTVHTHINVDASVSLHRHKMIFNIKLVIC